MGKVRDRRGRPRSCKTSRASCVFTLGLSEPNLSGKPVLEYDRIVKTHELHTLKAKVALEPKTGYHNRENESLFTILEGLEFWMLVHIANVMRDLKKRIPWVLGVEVDPNGGPRVQEAAMKL
ncbi:hypothetical protein GUJ93_ZPchr0014g47224 [Zizania palustris]|uniref:Hs1pro-1 C-terminal domain-containing protein n=1 Tax=Zizania palustris TaxID=103762 RepID=A0A8J5SWR9_ZIZPA|nr:hypothetical protein GUJ93_ZPchr0014g47224 [Zizania palustris]